MSQNSIGIEETKDSKASVRILALDYLKVSIHRTIYCVHFRTEAH